MTRKPKTLPLKRRLGAPPYVHAVHQEPGPNQKDTYMVFFTWPLWEPCFGRRQLYLEVVMGEESTYRTWGEISDFTDRQGCGRLISWSDLPESAKNAVYTAANFPDEIVIVEPSWEQNSEGQMAYLLGAADGYGYFGSPLGYSSIKKCREECQAKGWLLIEDPKEHAEFLKGHRSRKHARMEKGNA